MIRVGSTDYYIDVQENDYRLVKKASRKYDGHWKEYYATVDFYKDVSMCIERTIHELEKDSMERKQVYTLEEYLNILNGIIKQATDVSYQFGWHLQRQYDEKKQSN